METITGEEMKIDRTIVIKRAKEKGVSFSVIAYIVGKSYTRVRQIYFNIKTPRKVLSSLASKNSNLDSQSNYL